MDTNKELDDALFKAKFAILGSNNNFISTILCSLKHEWDDSIPTAATNGKVTKYNPDFFMSLEPSMRSFVVAHETWHIALGHLSRLGNKDPHIFNVAADYVINQMLVDSTTNYTMPVLNGKSIAYQDNRFRGMGTEEVYEILIQDSANQDKSSPMDGDISENPEISEEEQKELDEHIKSTLVKARNKSKLMGDAPSSIPGEVERLIDKLVNPKLPWETLLQRYVNSFTKEDYSWRKPNKRYFPDAILPSLYSESIGQIVVAVDTSGSLTQENITSILSELKGIHSRVRPQPLTIVSCDTKIHDIYNLSPYDRFDNVKLNGYGGTCFNPVFDYVNTLKQPPLLLIYFTDLYAKPITEKPKYPVLWVCNSTHKPALIGKTIYME